MTTSRDRPQPVRLPSHSRSSSSSKSPRSPHSPRGCPAAIHRSPTPPPPFRLLDLPPEVVNKIVPYALISPEPIVIHDPRFNRHPTPPPRARSKPKLDRKVPATPSGSRGASPTGERNGERELSPLRKSKETSPEKRRRAESQINDGHTLLALLLTCRQLYRDYWTVYYTENTFQFSNVQVLKRFINVIPSRCRNQIRSVSLHMPRNHTHDMIWQRLVSLKRLEYVEQWLRPQKTLQDAEIGEWEASWNGARKCPALKSITIRREGDKRLDNREGADTGGPEELGTQAQTQTQGPGEAGPETTEAENNDPEYESEQGDNNAGQVNGGEEQEIDGFEQVLKRDRVFEAKVNSWLRSREDEQETRQTSSRTFSSKPKSKQSDGALPGDDSSS